MRRLQTHQTQFFSTPAQALRVAAQDGSRRSVNSVNSARATNLAVIAAIIVAALWTATGAALSTRFHLVFFYETQTTVTPQLEVFAVSIAALLGLGLTSLVFPICVKATPGDRDCWPGLAFGCISALPIGLVFLRCFSDALPPPAVWEVVWFAGFTGLSFRRLVPHGAAWFRLPNWFWIAGLCAIAASALAWWLYQSHLYYCGFRLGFNDFGHFTQRIANTSAGRGFLLESPVLPTFWDHFNPGLALFAPVWWLWPSVYLSFTLQSLSLALPSLLLGSIVRKLGGSHCAAWVWGAAWLFHPSIGQMNLAYTYGWHPVTVAIPLLLLAYRLLLSSYFLLSAVMTILACSFEEGVVVVVGCYAAAMFLRQAMGRGVSRNEGILLSSRSWFAVFLIAIMSFGVIYFASGLATFQTGRFSKLGGSIHEIILSPILKPTEFWGLLFRVRNAAFLGLIFVPFLVSGIHRAGWHLLAVALPIGVLMVWEHLPAQSIAFQYAACLFPILFVGCIEGSLPLGTTDERVSNAGVAALATGWVLCFFVGQMPWSQETLIDVVGATYDLQQPENRSVGAEDNAWLTLQLQTFRTNHVLDSKTGIEGMPRALATGRIASHLVGLPDVETVGQYWQRRNDLVKLRPDLASPLLRYDLILLDFREQFQQSAEESVRVRDEALQHGFRVAQSQFDIQILLKDE